MNWSLVTALVGTPLTLLFMAWGFYKLGRISKEKDIAKEQSEAREAQIKEVVNRPSDKQLIDSLRSGEF